LGLTVDFMGAAGVAPIRAVSLRGAPGGSIMVPGVLPNDERSGGEDVMEATSEAATGDGS
jgi:hypothetical protein